MAQICAERILTQIKVISVKNIFLRKFAPSCCKTKEEMVIQVEDKFLAGVVEGKFEISNCK
jgi:hypothetical protein